MGINDRHTIHDPRFVNTLGRRFYDDSRTFERSPIIVIERDGVLEINITNGVFTMLCIGWQHGAAFVIAQKSAPRYVDDVLDHLALPLTLFVGKFVAKHKLMQLLKRGVA